MRIILGVSGLLLAAVCGCGRGPANSITVAGSTAFQPFAEKLAGHYMETKKGIDIAVQGGGSALGIQAARSGAAQIGMADLVKLPPEADELTRIVVARDGIALIVNRENGVQNLTLDQVRALFEGAITNWKNLGGEDRKVRIVSREGGSGTRASFEQIMGGIRLSREALVQDSNGTIRETVANDPAAIGYLSHGLLNERVKAVTIDGVECTAEEIGQGRYKLYRPVYFLTKGTPDGEIKAFIDYVLSEEGQEMIRRDGLLPAK